MRQRKHMTTFACQEECVRYRAYLCALTFAGLGVRFEDKSLRAGTGVGARSVSAQAVVAKQTVHITLVDVCAKTKDGTG